MKKYLVFSKSGYDAIENMKVDLLKLKATYRKKEFAVSRENYTISCNKFEIRYINVFLSNSILGIRQSEIHGVYGSELLKMISYENYQKFHSLDNNEFLNWLREGDLCLW